MLGALQTDLNQIEVGWVGRDPYPEFGQVHVQMIAAGICGAQLMELDGTKPSGPFPHLMGHEGVGAVQKVGTGVTTVKEGDKVVLHWRKGDGIESDFPKYMYNGHQITSGKVTTWAQEVTVSENRCTAVPNDAPDELCVLLGCGLSTALGTIEQEANLKVGESVLIIGCGGLGLNLIRAAKIRGASKIVVSDCVSEKAEMGLKAGATGGYMLLPVGGESFDVVIDTSGNSGAIADGLRLLAPSGRFIMVGQPKGSISVDKGNRLFSGDGCTIKATQGGGFRPHLDIPRYVQAWRAGVINLDGIITHRITLDEINEGIPLVRNGNAGRVLITL
jgi:S-(hydroxymethyl)glutathione dehydrogenase / alcohol dehydrogenase